VVLALSTTVILVLSGLSVDLGKVYLTRLQLQHMVDASAVAAAAHTPSLDQAVSIAKGIAGLNYPNGSGLITAGNTQVGSWDYKAHIFTPAPPSSLINKAVRITLTGKPASLIFGPLVGISTINVDAKATAAAQSVTCGVTGINSVTLKGNPSVNSYDSSQGPYNVPSSNAGVCSNGDISLIGNPTIYGNAIPGPGHTATGGTVTGTRTPNTQPLNFPAIDVGNAATTNDNSKIPLAANDGKGGISLSGKKTVSLPPGTYYLENFGLTGGSTINITGLTIIFVTGQLDVNGSAVVNSTTLPSNLQFFVTGSQAANMDLKGTPTFFGSIYAPQSDLKLAGTPDYYGTVVAKTVLMNGVVAFHVDQNDIYPGAIVRVISRLVE